MVNRKTIFTNLSVQIRSDLFETNSHGAIYPKICKLHGIFGEDNLFDDVKASKELHNCLGCNLAELTWGLFRTTEAWGHYERANITSIPGDLEAFYPTSTFFHWANTIIEGYEEILNIIKIDNSYKENQFKKSVRFRRWANFFKHPKAMLFTHHASFTFEDSSFQGEVIREPDVSKYWSASSPNDKKLFNRLSNQKHVTVVLPDLSIMITELQQLTEEFLRLIGNNEYFQSRLRMSSTYEDYLGADGSIGSSS